MEVTFPQAPTSHTSGKAGSLQISTPGPEDGGGRSAIRSPALCSDAAAAPSKRASTPCSKGPGPERGQGGPQPLQPEWGRSATKSIRTKVKTVRKRGEPSDPHVLENISEIRDEKRGSHRASRMPPFSPLCQPGTINGLPCRGGEGGPSRQRSWNQLGLEQEPQRPKMGRGGPRGPSQEPCGFREAPLCWPGGAANTAGFPPGPDRPSWCPEANGDRMRG